MKEGRYHSKMNRRLSYKKDILPSEHNQLDCKDCKQPAVRGKIADGLRTKSMELEKKGAFVPPLVIFT